MWVTARIGLTAVSRAAYGRSACLPVRLPVGLWCIGCNSRVETGDSTNMTLYDKTDTFHWSNEVGGWGKYNDGDVFIGLDPQRRFGEGTISVTEFHEDGAGHKLEHRGLFWEKEQAEMYAEVLHDGS